MDMPVCEAHNIIENEINRLKDNDRELYSLDRKRQQEIAEMTADVRVIKNEQQIMKKDITELKSRMDEVNEKTADMCQKVDRITTDIENVKKLTGSMNNTLNQYMNKPKWQPKDYCVVIVAALSMIGVIVSAVLSYLK